MLLSAALPTKECAVEIAESARRSFPVPLLVQSGCRLLRIRGCAHQHKVSPKPSPDPATETRAWECQPTTGGGSIPEFCSYFIQNGQGEQGEKTRLKEKDVSNELTFCSIILKSILLQMQRTMQFLQ